MQSVEKVFHAASLSYQAGRLDEAELGYRTVLDSQPNNSQALHMLGVVSIHLGKNSQAISHLEAAIRLDGNEPAYYRNLSVALAASGQLTQAIDVCLNAIKLAPDNSDFHLFLGQLLLQSGRCEDATIAFRNAVHYGPNNAEAFRSLGRALLNNGSQLSESVRLLERAIILEPNLAEAYNELGVALHRLNRNEESVQLFLQAIQRKPNYPNAFTNLSTAYRVLGEWDKAEAACRHATLLDPMSADSHLKLGVLLTDIGSLDEANVHFRKAMELRPDCANTHSRFLFSLQYRPGITAEELLEAHSAFNQQHGLLFRQFGSPRNTVTADKRPLRIGFVSDGMGKHPVGSFLSAFVDKVDGDVFKLVFYSDRKKKDESNEGLRSVASLWRDTADQSHEELAARIRDDQIDILFDLDGHIGRRLMVFTRRPAPVQVTWMGYVGTTGLTCMDYLLADRWEVPIEATAHYTEKIVRMPNGYVCYAPWSDSPDVSDLPAIKNGYITFGCLNQPAKVNVIVLEAWAKILHQVPKSCLRLQYKGYDASIISERIRKTFNSLGVDPSRLQISGNKTHREMLTAYQSIDIGLDTFPYSGGMTTCESLWMGVPVVTVPKDTFASRHSLSHMSNVGLLSTLANSEADYVDLAIRLARDVEVLSNIRRSLRPQMAGSPLCDGQLFAKDWCDLLKTIWKQNCDA